MMVAAPVVWVALEYFRAYAVTGFPWYYLAHSQHQVLPMIQVADFAGSLGVSFVVAVVNAWLVDVLTRPLLRPTVRGARLTPPQAVRIGVVAALVGGTLTYGAYRIGSARFRPGPRVALLQSSLIQRLKQSKSPNDIAMIYSNLVDRALRTERPDLIVWPETSYPYPYVEIAPKLDSAGLERQMKGLGSAMSAAERRSQQDAIRNHLRGWTDQLKVAMLIGAVTYDHRPDGLLRYNSAILYQPGEAAVQSFHKLHLVPFGEYVPLVETFPWLIALTPYHGGHVPSLSFGPEPKWLALGPYRLAAVICFEDTVPQVVRRFFREAKDGRHPDLLVNMSNDGWFHGSSEHDMHLAVSVFRAVEHRVPMARAANTGISAIVDGNGRVVESLPKLKEGVLTGVVPLDDRAALYSVWGDWLGQSCLAVTIGLVPMAVLWPRLRARRGR
jgi:apolipoprotein N-acyltransferase